MVIRPTGKGLGAEIQCGDLKRIGDAHFEAVHKAWLDHLVLLFRGQQLTDDDFIVFSRRFGHLDWAPMQETGRRFVDGYPEIYVVSNVVENHIDFRITIHEAAPGLLHRRPVEMSEAPAEYDEIVVRELLPAKQENQMIEPSFVNGLEMRVADAFQIPALDFRSQTFTCRTDHHHETLYQVLKP